MNVSSIKNEISVSKKPLIYSEEAIASLDSERIPEHVAIIPDGNRRWAMRQGAATQAGHRHGADTLIETMKAAKELGVKTMTFYVFSTENWNRTQEEVDGFMWLLDSYLTAQRETMIEEGIRLHTIGDPLPLAENLRETIAETEKQTSFCSDIDMVLAINYGSRDEICRAARSLCRAATEGKISPDSIDETLFAEFLDTARWSDPDLLIRTSGEHRISNFLNWQLAYTEIYTPEVLWPDFTHIHFLEALQHYQRRIRRHGN